MRSSSMMIFFSHSCMDAKSVALGHTMVHCPFLRLAVNSFASEPMAVCGRRTMLSCRRSVEILKFWSMVVVRDLTVCFCLAILSRLRSMMLRTSLIGAYGGHVTLMQSGVTRMIMLRALWLRTILIFPSCSSIHCSSISHNFPAKIGKVFMVRYIFL